MSAPPCPVLGCRRTRKPDQVMCPGHWSAVPIGLRRDVWRTWRGGAIGEYMAARKAALDAVGGEAA